MDHTQNGNGQSASPNNTQPVQVSLGTNVAAKKRANRTVAITDIPKVLAEMHWEADSFIKEMYLKDYWDAKKKKTPFHYPESLNAVYKRETGKAYAQEITSPQMLHKISLREYDTDKTLYARVKRGLPFITTGGVCAAGHSEETLEQYNGVYQIDIDKLTPHDAVSLYEKIKNDPYVSLAFVSPSGRGVKALFHTDNATKEEHEGNFPAVERYFQTAYGMELDECGKTFSQVAFVYATKLMSAKTPAIRFALPKNKEAKKARPAREANTATKSLDDVFNDYNTNGLEDFITEMENKGFVFEGEKSGRFYLTRPGATNPDSGNIKQVNGIWIVYWHSQGMEHQTPNKGLPLSIAYAQEFHSDDRRASWRALAEKGYGKPRPSTKTGSTTYKSTPDKSNEEDRAGLEEETKRYGIEFFSIKKNNQGEPYARIKEIEYKMLLEELGFWRYCPEGEPKTSSKISCVRIQDNIVKEVDSGTIQEAVMAYIDEHVENEEESDLIKTKMIKDFHIYCGVRYYSQLPIAKIKALKDTHTESYIPFQNGILCVGKSGERMMPYKEAKGAVWADQINPHVYSPNTETSEYEKFIRNVSANDPQRELAMRTAIGYLLHNQMEPDNAKAIVLMDEELSNDKESNGGTGKGLFCQAVSKVRKQSFIDGKRWKNDNRFGFQTVQTDTQVIWIDDIKKDFDFSALFSAITDGLEIEKKGRDAIRLEGDDMPKFVLSTNFAVGGQGNSHDRRRVELEFSPYYKNLQEQGVNRPVSAEHGGTFFKSWDKTQWDAFYGYMIGCLKLYMEHGDIVKCANVNADERKLRQETSEEFVSWMDDLPKEDIEYNKNVLFQCPLIGFVSLHDDFRPWLKQRTFTGWMRIYAKVRGYQVYERRSNNNFLIKFSKINT